MYNYKKISLTEFINSLKGIGADFEGLEFSKDEFGDKVDIRSYINQYSPYSNNRDDKNRIRTPGITFTNCLFNTDFIFEDLNFTLFVGFKNIIINSNIIFKNTCFNEGLDYEECDGINSHIKFEKNEMNTIVMFNKCLLNNLEFKDVKFNDSFFIKGSKIENTFTISNTVFNGDSYFGYMEDDIIYFRGQTLIDSEFNANCSFSNIIFDKLDFYSKKQIENVIEFNNLDFKEHGYFRNLRMNENYIFKNCNLKECSFLYSTFNKVIFSSCDFGDYVLHDDKNSKIFNKRDNKSEKDRIKLTAHYTGFDVINEYRMFEMNFDYYKQFEIAGFFHVNKFNLERKVLPCNYKWFLLTLYKYSSNYGESYKISSIWFFIIFLVFSIIYLFTGIHYINGNNDVIIYYFKEANRFCYLNDWGCGLLYSLINSIPFKKSLDYLNNGSIITNVISIFQIIIQSILITLFIIGIRRKFKR